MTGRRVSVLRLMLAAIRGQFRRFLLLGIVGVLGMAAAVAGLTISSYGSTSADAATGDDSVLSRVSLFNDVSSLPFRAVDDVKTIPGVAAVMPVLRVPAGLDESKSSLIVVGADQRPLAPLDRGAVAETGPAAGEIVLPSTADGVDLSGYLGKQVTLTYTIGITASSGTTKDLPLTVIALYDPTYQVDAPLAGYVSLATAEELAIARAGVTKDVFESSIGFDRIDVTASSVASVPSVVEALQAEGYHAVAEIQRIQQVPGAVQVLRGASLVLFVVMLILAIGTAVTVANGIATERARELALLRTCGWAHPRVCALLMGEAGFVVVLSCLLGGALGAGTAAIVGDGLRAAVADGSLGAMSVPWDQVGPAATAFVVCVGLAYLLAVMRVTRRPVAAVLQEAL